VSEMKLPNELYTKLLPHNLKLDPLLRRDLNVIGKILLNNNEVNGIEDIPTTEIEIGLPALLSA
jgi:hypothetical protein